MTETEIERLAASEQRLGESMDSGCLMTITLPVSLKMKMNRTSINWSGVAVKAFQAALDETEQG